MDRQSELMKLLDEALQTPTGERESFLQRVEDCELAGAVQELLDRQVEFDEDLVGPVLATSDPTVPGGGPRPGDERPVAVTDLRGQRIGPFEVLEVLGRGGMGTVYLADQLKPMNRRVALKVIDKPLVDEATKRRFEGERQAMGRLDHPNIGKLLEAGTTNTGQPYFAMELIDGCPIGLDCDRNRRSVEERIRLFIDVCRATAHAHSRLVLHRDLKPSNVMVSEVDGEPFPKVIDFGIAKALDEPLTGAPLTVQGLAVGTPAYMSPEAVGHGGEVDVRTDVFSLGVMLYELLVGNRPWAADVASPAARVQDDAPPPSVRLKTLDGELREEIGSNRGVAGSELIKQIEGDLDWIVLRAIAADPERRYPTVLAFAEDLERWLAFEPVLARPPSTSYRISKFVRRHQAGVSVFAVGLVLLVGFAMTMTIQASRIAAERDRANAALAQAEREARAKSEVSNFLQSLFEMTDPNEARGESVTARELLDRGAVRIEEELADEPELQAEIMLTIGGVYRGLGLYEDAQSLVIRAVELRRELFGADHEATLQAKASEAGLMILLGRHADAEERWRKVLGDSRRVLGNEHLNTLQALRGLARVLRNLGRYKEAEPLVREAWETQRRVLGEDHLDTLSSLSVLAVVVMTDDRLQEAELLLSELLERQRRVFGNDHPSTLVAMNNLASLLGKGLGRHEDAGPLYRETLEIRTRVLGEDHSETLIAVNNLAGHYSRLGDSDRALEGYERAWRGMQRTLGEEHPSTLAVASNVARVWAEKGQDKEAEMLHREILHASQRTMGLDNASTAIDEVELARFLWTKGGYDEAAELLRHSIGVFDEVIGEDASRTLAAKQLLAATYLMLDRHDAARQLAQEALDGRKLHAGSEHPLTLQCVVVLAEVALRSGNQEEAEQTLVSVLETLRSSDENKGRESALGDTHYALAALAAARGNSNKALEELGYVEAQAWARARLRVDPLFEQLRRTPELRLLLARPTPKP